MGESVLNKFRGKNKKHQPSEHKKDRIAAKHEWGGVRNDEFGVGYWLTANELDELSILNLEIDEDVEFWAAFRELRKRLKIPPMRGQGRSRFDDDYEDWVGWGTDGASKSYVSHDWTDPTKNKSSLSEWWTGWKSWGGSENSTKLALALKAAQVTVNVIDDNPKVSRMRVRFAMETDEPVNYTNFKNNEIVVSPKPILDGKLLDGEAFDVITAEGLHEASHAKYTRNIIGQVEKDPRIDPLAVSSLLVNILEDVRIEAMTSQEFPGFAAYFDKVLAWMWDQRAAGPKTTYGPSLDSKLNAMIGYCRWPQHFTEAEHVDELKWWRAWLARYRNDGSNARKLAEEGIEHLRLPTSKEQAEGKDATNSQAAQEMDAQTKQEEALRKLGNMLSDIIRDFLDKHGKIRGYCTHKDAKTKHDSVSVNEADIIAKRVEEDIEQERPVIMAEGASNPNIVITKPKEDLRSRECGSRPVSPIVKKYKRALLFRPAKPIHALKLLKDGKVDSTQLWRWAGDDWRVFQKREINSTPAARVYLLVDMSGSMGGPKINAAHEIATLFVTALNSIDGVVPKVFGHTGDIGSTQSEVYRIWEPGDPLTRLGLINTMPKGNNYDGHAIAYVTKRMEQDSQPGEQRIVIVLSDGLPSGSGYGGFPGMEHVRKVVGEAEKRRIRVLQIAIDHSLDTERQSRMFDEFIPFSPGDGLDEIPRRLEKWLEKIL